MIGIKNSHEDEVLDTLSIEELQNIAEIISDIHNPSMFVRELLTAVQDEIFILISQQ